MSANICPVCGLPRVDKQVKAAVIGKLMAMGYEGELVDPGGRVIIFKDGSRVRVYDECIHCDAAAINAYARMKPTKPLPPLLLCDPSKKPEVGHTFRFDKVQAFPGGVILQAGVIYVCVSVRTLSHEPVKSPQVYEVHLEEKKQNG